jgi:hypothetical protein
VIRVAALLFALAFTTLAHAKPSETFSREYQSGIDAFRLGELSRARTHLEKARSLEPKLPGPHRFLAAVARAQRRWTECITEARLALLAAPRSAEIEDTRRLYDSCRVGAGRAPYDAELIDTAAIAVESNVSGATIKIRGLVYGGTPLAPRPIPPGRVVVDIEKAGYKPVRVEIEALSGIVTDIVAELVPVVDPEAPPAIRTGTLVLPSLPPNTRILIDGKALERPADGRLALRPGIRIIELAAPGMDPWRRRVDLALDATATLAPVLVDRGPRERRRRGGYLALGVGAGAAGVAVGGLFLARRDEDRANVWYGTAAATGALAVVAGGVGGLLVYRNGDPAPDDVPAFAFALTPLAHGAMLTRSTVW